jgi:hypothetical protein
VKEDERGGQGNFHKPIPSVCHMTPCYEHALFLHECFFDLVFCFVCNGWHNGATCLHLVCVKLGKSATETLDMLHDAFGEHSLSQTVVFEWHSHFKAGRMSVEDDKHSG